MRVCIYTAIYGGYDTLKRQPPQSVAADFVCFTDQTENFDPVGWRVIVDRRMRNAHPRMRAKYFKVLNHRVFGGLGRWRWGLPRYDATIWVDGNVQIMSEDFVKELLAQMREMGIAMCVHPSRDCIYEELIASERMLKYRGQPIKDQIESYRIAGYPVHNGLMACGVIVRLSRAPKLAGIERHWWREITQWSYQDQISLPFVLWRNHTWYDEIKLNIFRNDLWRVTAHNSDR